LGACSASRCIPGSPECSGSGAGIAHDARDVDVEWARRSRRAWHPASPSLAARRSCPRRNVTGRAPLFSRSSASICRAREETFLGRKPCLRSPNEESEHPRPLRRRAALHCALRRRKQRTICVMSCEDSQDHA
jgi:hypothetical protein